jgi:aldehyde:ferredoxin oxidoreductase
MRILSGRAGHTMEEDGLPPRFANPLPSGASKDHPVDPSVMRKTIGDYYGARGYDRYGPTDETLRQLDMEDCIGMLERG